MATQSAAGFLLVGIGGGSASGKSTLASELISLGQGDVVVLEIDRFYHCLGDRSDKHLANFDEPAALDFELLVSVLEQLKSDGTTLVPKYDFTTHTRAGFERFDATRVVIVEGILALHDARLLRGFDQSIFVDAPASIRFKRREQRDIAERGRDAESVKRQWDQTVHPMHSMYVESSKEIADIVIDGTGDLVVAARELLASWKVQP